MLDVETMSESSKMGLFGSKDKNKEFKKEHSTIEESPDRYAPYCIDSDSETYDTEALSIMDINDIIGVQSEPVSDSTLESEIAALSQIITDSKAESNQNIAHTKSAIDKSKDSNIICNDKSMIDDVDIDKLSESHTEKKCVLNINISNKHVAENVKLNRPKKEDLTTNSNNSPTSLFSSEFFNKDHSGNHLQMQKKSDVKEFLHDFPLSVTEIVVLKDPSTSTTNKLDYVSDEKRKSDTNNLVSVQSISESLQLIGEAYISEDSQETNLNDCEINKEQSVRFIKNSTIHNEDKKSEPDDTNNESQSKTNTVKSFKNIELTDITVEKIDSLTIMQDDKLKNRLDQQELTEALCIVESANNIKGESMNSITIDNNEEDKEEEAKDNIENRTMHSTNMKLVMLKESIEKEEPLKSNIMKTTNSIEESTADIKEVGTNMEISSVTKRKHVLEHTDNILTTFHEKIESINTNLNSRVGADNQLQEVKQSIDTENKDYSDETLILEMEVTPNKFVMHNKCNDNNNENKETEEIIHTERQEIKEPNVKNDLTNFLTNTKVLESSTEDINNLITETKNVENVNLVSGMINSSLIDKEDNSSVCATINVDTSNKNIVLLSENKIKSDLIPEMLNQGDLIADSDSLDNNNVISENQTVTTEIEIYNPESSKSFSMTHINSEINIQNINNRIDSTTISMNLEDSSTTNFRVAAIEVDSDIRNDSNATTTENKELLVSYVIPESSMQLQNTISSSVNENIHNDFGISIQIKKETCLSNEIKQNNEAQTQDNIKICLPSEVKRNDTISTQDDTKLCLSDETKENVEISKQTETAVCITNEIKDNFQLLMQDRNDACLINEEDNNFVITTQTETDACLSNETDENFEVSTEAENKMSLPDETKEILETSTETKIETFLSKEVEKDVKMVTQVETEVCLSNEADKNSEVSTKAENKMNLQNRTKEILETSTETKIETFLLKETEKDVAMIIQAETEVCLSNEADENFKILTESENKMSLPDETKEILEASTETEIETFLLNETEKDVAMIIQAETEVCLSKEADENFEMSTETEKMSLPDETKEILETSTETKTETFLLKETEKDVTMVMQAETEVCLSNEADENFEISTEAENKMSIPDETEEILETSTETESKIFLLKKAEKDIGIVTQAETEVCLSNEADENFEISTKAESEMNLSDEIKEILEPSAETEVCLSNEANENFEISTKVENKMSLSDEIKEVLEPSAETQSEKFLLNETDKNLEITTQVESETCLSDDASGYLGIKTQVETEACLSNCETLTQAQTIVCLSDQTKEILESSKQIKNKILTNGKGRNLEMIIQAEFKMGLPDDTEKNFEIATQIETGTRLSGEIRENLEILTQSKSEISLSNEMREDNQINIVAEPINENLLCNTFSTNELLSKDENRSSMETDDIVIKPTLTNKEIRDSNDQQYTLYTDLYTEKGIKEETLTFTQNVNKNVKFETQVDGTKDRTTELEEQIKDNEINTPNIEEKEEESDNNKIKEDTNLVSNIEEPELHMQINIQKIEENLEKMNTRLETVTEFNEHLSINVEDKNIDSKNTSENEINEINLTNTCLINDNVPKLLEDDNNAIEKPNIKNDLNKPDEEHNLRNILETTNNVVEIFSEEHCQNAQDIMASILSNVRNVDDFKSILDTEESTENEIEEVLRDSEELPLVDTEIKELAEKLPVEHLLHKDIEEPITAQNIDSLEGLLDLNLIPESEERILPKTKKLQDEIQEHVKTIQKNVDMTFLLKHPNDTLNISQDRDYITNVTTNKISEEKLSDHEPKIDLDTPQELLKIKENIIAEPSRKDTNNIDIQKQLEIDNNLQDNDLDMDFIENPLETVEDLENSKLEISQDILLGSTNQNETLNDTTTSMEAFQPSSEISELESAVKFLQESEEQIIDSPLILSPKMVESVVNNVSKVDDSDLFVPDEDVCEDASQLVAELQEIAADSISISEAEIISEAAKLETERKLAEHMKLSTVSDNEHNNVRLDSKKIEEQPSLNTISYTDMSADKLCNENMLQKLYFSQDEDSANSTKMTDRVRNIVESIPKISILEERLKEPPKIEIPQMEITKLCNAPSTPKDNLLIPKDAKIAAYQKMLESPKFVDNKEQKLIDTPRRDVEKHDFENVGSPRIILKIAKSAIADCSEPRSPKSPKIRSATNSPNPEDSPGQKLGKIKLKLSKSGHPSIISNENIDEISQWHSEGTASLSPIGMKIKLSKSGDALIVPSEKHESLDDLKEIKHKFEETKRTESPIGMKIKLSKSGDASIVQQDLKDITIKYKEKLDIQGSPKRTESPIGMKIKLSKTGDASIVQLDKQETHKEQKDGNTKSKEKIDITYELPKRTESPIGMKIKLSKSGDLSIIPTDTNEEGKDTIMEPKDKLESFPEIPKRTDSPIGMKIKLTKTKSGASIISMDNSEESKEKSDVSDVPKRIESPLGMKIKLSKSGDASIIHSEISDEPKEIKYKEKIDIAQDTTKQPEISSGVKIKVVKSGEASVITSEPIERFESNHDILQRMESGGMKIKIPKSSDALLIPVDKQEQIEEHKYRDIHQDTSKRTESPIGMKIKLSKTGDASIIQTDTSEDNINRTIRKVESEYLKSADTSLGMKIKLLKSNDNSTPESDRKEKQQKRRDVESPLEMKIKLSKTGHPTIIACDSHTDCTHKVKDIIEASHNFTHRYKDPMLQKDPALKILKTGHSTIVQSNRSELTIEPVQIQGKKLDNAIEISSKRKEITISPIESKKSKLEAQLSQILPEVTIQPVMSRDQKQLLFDPKTSLISRQQMNVISQEISITQVRPPKPVDMSMSEKLKNILCKNITNSPIGSDCEIIEHRPELIIVNENSNSSQDVMIIEEVPPIRMPEVKIPKKRGRPRRNPLPSQLVHPPQILMPRDPLALDEMPHLVQLEHRENERPKRTCRNQKSYAPPRRGRGRGRGKRKLESSDHSLNKKSRIEQDLTAIEASTMAIITIDESPTIEHPLQKSSELYKALKQSPADIKNLNPICKIEKQPLILVHKEVIKQSNIPKNILSDSSITVQSEPTRNSDIQGENSKIITNQSTESILLSSRDNERDRILLTQVLPQKEQKTMEKSLSNNKAADKVIETGKPTGHESKDILVPPGHSNWLTPTLKKQIENSSKNETITTVQVIDEETRMSAESVSRSQTPARNISMPASETIVNEESQGSVLSTATTESEKVKVKNRRMEINFDPDEGPFTVDKIAEYEWPLERKGETFMIQEQISQYLGVKSFKRKYPDLKRRMVDMEERNYLRENGLVSEAMCDMGLTAICSSEVLDVMCSDFPDQYEEYRKHMREKQIKEHSKKQKELTAAANAEKNRIDLAEMAVQSALSWNINLNKARKENRKCSLDLQSFTIHVPKKHQKIEMERKLSHYPVPLIPGQYTDYYREYTPAELRYYPLNTVLYGPMRPNERKFDSQSEGSQSDSDSDSSSDDSSSSSSEGTQDTEGSQSTMDDVDMEISNQKDESKLKCKMCLKILNKHSKNEVLIQCGTCNGYVHPSCIQLTLDMVPQIQSYAWQCTDCKTCAQCHDPADEAKMLFCDMCDRGYHIYCVGLRRVPVGRWHCQECAVCANCGSREPGGANSDRNSVAQWQHEFKKGDKNTRVYVSTLCVPCSKLWRKGRYCPHCSRCHTVPRLDLEANLVHCSACDKYLHLGCVETKGVAFDKKNYLCDFCTPNRQQLMKPLVSKVFKT